MDEQEEYLKKTSFKDIILRGLKKLITELTSIKTLVLAAFIVMMFFKIIDGWVGIVGSLAILGIREVPESILNKFVK